MRRALATALGLLAALALAPAATAQDRPPTTATAKVYFIAGEQFTAVDREIARGPDVIRQLVGQLILGPTVAERAEGLRTQLPAGTRLLGVSVTTAEQRVNLTFNKKAGETNAAVKTRDDAIRVYFGRLGQVVRTITGFTGAKSVRIFVPGRGSITLAAEDLERPPGGPEYSTPKARGPAPTDPGAVQEQLVALRYLPQDAVTGAYDYRTQQAVLAFQSWEGLGRDGVVGPATAGRLATAKTPVPVSRATVGRRIEIHRDKGVVLLLQGSTVVRAIHTSTGQGADSPLLGTPPGSFKVYRKEQRSWSVPYRVWLPDAVYWDRGWALHGYPDVPARPASHGCARLPLQEAPIVYAFAKIGTPVRVI